MHGMNRPELLTPSTPVEAPGGSSASTGRAEALRLLAAQFEAVLLSQMLSAMRTSVFGDEESSGFGSGPLADALYTELSLALSRAGGLGIGDALLEPLMKATESGEHLDAPGAPGPGALSGWPSSAGLPSAMNLPAAIGLTTAAGLPGTSSSTKTTAFDAAAAVATAVPPRAALFEGRLSSAFGWREHPVTGGVKFHSGVDIAMPEGRDVPAARAGEVTFAGEQGGYGLTVVIDHGNGVSTRYAHLSELRVKEGERVADGQTIGLSGATGRVTGPHLHFEVLEHGRPVDPSAGIGRLYASR